ncbi:MAG: glutamate--tRNA ligase [Deltaproteobacteria bacterium]|nr:glutamate--tRNA ligase [Deltaproteobacteria bacterium]
MKKVRTRFPPSPTGKLHIGGVRTALFNWLFSRHHKGEFILRIEDTDVERSSKEDVDVILEGLKWLGIDWDEGPYFQSERLHIYQEHVKKLLDEGKAYRCYCEPEVLEAKRIKALKEGRKPKYDGTCRNLKNPPKDKPFAIRFASPQEGKTIVNDLIKGRIEFDNQELDDLIIQRRNGLPTYNFAVVVDDATMGITHVIRGDDHVNNTPRQIQLYKALGYPLPEFAHVPMILGNDKKRLSKRHGATSIMEYKDAGYLASAMVNYLVRLGWSHGDQEIFTIDELIEYFSLDHVGKSAGVFNPEKLLWVNSEHIKMTDDIELSKLLKPFVEAKGYKIDDENLFIKQVATLKGRANTLKEMVEIGAYYFKEEVEIDPSLAKKFLTSNILPFLEFLIKKFSQLTSFTKENIQQIFIEYMDKEKIKLGKIAQPVRVALTGGTVSPGIFELIEAIGQKRVIKRLKQAQNLIKNNS